MVKHGQYFKHCVALAGKNDMDKSCKSFLIILPLIGLYGCDISPSDDLSSSGGLVNKGVLSNAIANAYRADTKELVKTVYTQTDGTFSLDDINFQGSLFVEVTTTSQTLATCDGANGCGNFPNGLKQAGELDNNLNGQIDFADKYFFHDQDFVLTAYIKPSSSQSGTGKFAVTPLTHLAAEKISQLQDASPEKIELVNAQVAELFGLNGSDITRVIPPDITNENAMSSADKTQQLYAALNAAVASAAASTSTSVADVINTLAVSFKENNGLVGNSNDSTKVTLASLQTLANDVADVVESTLNITLTDIKEQIQGEITEQLAKPADEVVEVSIMPVLVPDFDKDGIGDEDEINLGTDPYNPDTDADGIVDGIEIQNSLDPLNPDTDGDGILDGLEVIYQLDPLDGTDAQQDPDGDGLKNFEEVNAGSDPFNSDSDGDSLNDGLEVNTYGTSPNNPDTDGDGLSDDDEINNVGTSPTNSDSDADGMADGWEIAFSLDPLVAADAITDNDGDGLLNKDEYHLSTNPNAQDTDGDGTNDDLEDFDNDGINNLDEVVNGLDPFFDDANLDADLDSISNIGELTNGSDLNIANPVIEFLSDADIYVNSSTGNIKMEISTDENFIVASQLDVTDLDIAGLDTGGFTDILIHDLFNNSYELPVRDEVNPAILLNSNSSFVDLSVDGHSILFSSMASNVISGDGNGSEDLFVYDRITQTSRRLGTNALLNNNSYFAKFSADAYRVFMESYSTSLVSPDSNGFGDVFIYDLGDIPANDSVSLASKNYLGADSSNDQSNVGDMSADGQRIVFTSRSNDIVDATGGTDTGTMIDVYFLEVPSTYHRVSKFKDAAEDDVGADSGWVKISENGKGIVYQTPKDILDLNVAGVGAGFNQIFHVDVDKMLAGDSVEQFSTLVSSAHDATNNGYGDGHSDGETLKISADGQRVYYKSFAQNISPNYSGDGSDEQLYVWDKATGQSHLATQYAYGMNGAALNYDATPSSHTNGMGITDFVINSEGDHIYALMDYGHEYTDAPGLCAGVMTYCLYKIKLAMPFLDQDGDGLSDLAELKFASNIHAVDSDGDGLNDGQEVYVYKTSPINGDTDGDSMNDGQEITNSTDPLDPASN